MNNLNIASPKIDQPLNLKIQLKEHQKTAINAMINFEDTGIVAFTKKAYVENYQILMRYMIICGQPMGI